MQFRPIDKMWERISITREDSDASLFLDLLYFGEMITKLITASIIACIEDEKDKHRYRLSYNLVHASSLGAWEAALFDALNGPASQFIQPSIIDDRKEITQKVGEGDWQFEAVAKLEQVLFLLDIKQFETMPKVPLKKWIIDFVVLRNKTRGHGAPTVAKVSQACYLLEGSIQLIVENLSLFKKPWAYLYQNISRKYRVTSISENVDCFDIFKHSTNQNLRDGLYIYSDKFTKIDLIFSDPDASDFYFPNGGFTENKFELLSYYSGNKKEEDSSPYLTPVENLPKSETQGLESLRTIGDTFTNIPDKPNNYICRNKLEEELHKCLLDDRHPMITLLGRGGIGKTWLGLTVLHDIALHSNFNVIIWFSARDIDLLQTGPKIVRPHTVSNKEIAKEFVNLLNPKEKNDKSFKQLSYLSNYFQKSEIGKVLFVFDNFETVRDPIETYNWINTNIRLPNKVLITTRKREFKGDYPIEVSGMSDRQCKELIDRYSKQLGIQKIITSSYKTSLIEEARGHPYVIKILLGEVAKEKKVLKVKRIIATKDDILQALFERTFSGLSQAAKRIFLTLCNWRSSIPMLALQALYLKPSVGEKLDVTSAIDELTKSSFIEISYSKDSFNMEFISVPLVASIFGKRKLPIAPLKRKIEEDTKFLQCFGTSQQTDVIHGIKPRVERMFQHVADKVCNKGEEISNYSQTLEFLASNYTPAWLTLSELYEECNMIDASIDAVMRFLESDNISKSDKIYSWKRISRLCEMNMNWYEVINSLLELCQIPKIPFGDISNSVNTCNALFKERFDKIGMDEKQIMIPELLGIIDTRIDEADAQDYSRFAWLAFNIKDKGKAKEYVNKGLQLDVNNFHLQRLKENIELNSI